MMSAVSGPRPLFLLPRDMPLGNKTKGQSIKRCTEVERALAIPDLMLGRYTVSLPTFPLHSYEP